MMKLIDKNKFLEGLNVDVVLRVIDRETLYDSDRMEYKLPMMSLFASLLKLPIIDAVERSEYEKMKDLCEQYRYERDVLEEKQRNRGEVVQCENCKFFEPDLYPTAFVGNGICFNRHWTVDNVGHEVRRFDYCSYGERKG